MKNPAFAGGCIGAWRVAVPDQSAWPDRRCGGHGNGGVDRCGAICAKALQRSLLGASSGFWHSVPGRWLIGRVAGLAVILLLVFPVYYVGQSLPPRMLLRSAACAGRDGGR